MRRANGDWGRGGLIDLVEASCLAGPGDASRRAGGVPQGRSLTSPALRGFVAALVDITDAEVLSAVFVWLALDPAAQSIET